MKIQENVDRKNIKKNMKKNIMKREEKLNGNREIKSALMRKEKSVKLETTSPSMCLWNEGKDRLCEGLCERGMGLEWAGRMVHNMDSEAMENMMRYM
jgi:hypothetical protein